MGGVLHVGIEKLSSMLSRTTGGFSDYLSPSGLSYISRDAFIQEHPEHSGLIGEAEIFKKMSTSDRHGGVIIYGDGGIGKTRLMLEVGLMAEKNEWTVYYIHPTLKNLSLLEDVLLPGGNYLLLFDSLESHPLFAVDLIDKLTQIEPEASVKVMGTCRNIYNFASTFPQSKEFQTVELTLKGKEDDVAFNDLVIEQILKDIPGNSKISSELYLIRPAFAVFIRYLQEKFSANTTKSILPTAQPPLQWLKTKLATSLGKKTFEDLYQKKEWLYLLFILPANGPAAKGIYERYGQVIDLLAQEGWLEKTKPTPSTLSIHVVHHSLVDKILVHHLENSLENLEEEIKNIFQFALDLNSFSSCIRAFERASGHKSLKNKGIMFSDIFSHFYHDRREAHEQSGATGDDTLDG